MIKQVFILDSSLRRLTLTIRRRGNGTERNHVECATRARLHGVVRPASSACASVYRLYLIASPCRRHRRVAPPTAAVIPLPTSDATRPGLARRARSVEHCGAASGGIAPAIRFPGFAPRRSNARIQRRRRTTEDKRLANSPSAAMSC
jgi:hypothetical protein